MFAKIIGGAIVVSCALMYFVMLVSSLLKGDLEKFIGELIMFVVLAALAIPCFSF